MNGYVRGINKFSCTTLNHIREIVFKPKRLNIQQELVEELEKSIGSSKDGSKVTGKFKRLAPFKDCDEIWRVGSRMREFTPFTEDNKPPALLPFGNRLTLLLMKDAHEKRHSGVSDTVSQFRLLGY